MIRTIGADGKETVQVKFIIDETVVAKVEKEKREERKVFARNVVKQRRRKEGIDDDLTVKVLLFAYVSFHCTTICTDTQRSP